ncbi:MAG TPA: hypothetical protein VK796_11190 [Cytophaga sp.]|nr:hypothetical protein [Cytophaga sp.]
MVINTQYTHINFVLHILCLYYVSDAFPDSRYYIFFKKIALARLNKLSKTHTEKELNLIIDVEKMTDNPDSTEELGKVLQSI